MKLTDLIPDNYEKTESDMLQEKLAENQKAQAENRKHHADLHQRVFRGPAEHKIADTSEESQQAVFKMNTLDDELTQLEKSNREIMDRLRALHR